ncbi:hypothetical protein [Puia dinghuensis]|uniref:DUF4760 domain-containing protein n=1 Tax=Puia dinghuensis TaxID=1792502 RepID=A0A8J2XPZ5_9BACT|nr:hypothetical protein [Puia dinghuensis]GGA82518.1 hypothetical protein GCM10011511_01870 [Puia dinghuensis]
MIAMQWVEWVARVVAGLGAGLGITIAAFNYRYQTRIKQAEWLKSLFEKFYESSTYKEVRVWLDYGVLHEQLTVTDATQRQQNEERFTDFLNFFEFIGVLHFRGHLPLEQVRDVFDYYLTKIGADADCKEWIDKYSFEKLKGLLARI